MKPQRKVLTKMPDVGSLKYDQPTPFSATDKYICTITSFDYKTQHRTKMSPSSGETSSLGNFVKIYFHFAYFLLACPFRVVTNDDGKYVIKKWRLQQMCCALMQFFCFIRLVTEVRYHIEREYNCKSATKNPVQYFKIIQDVSSFVYKVVTMKRMWLNQQDYLNALNCTRRRSHFAPTNTMLKVIQAPAFLCFFYSLVSVWAFTSFFVGKSFVDESSSWSAALWANQLVKLGRYTFFAANKFLKKDSTLIIEQWPLDGFRAFVMSFCMIQRYIFGLFCDIFILSFTITLWSASKVFSDRIIKFTNDMNESESDLTNWNPAQSNVIHRKSLVSAYTNSWSEVYHHFRLIQKLSMGINIALGGQVSWFMAEAVMYYSVNLNLVLSSNDVFVRIDLAFFYFSTFGILFISADICTQMESIKLWISFGENRKTLPADEFSIVLHEMIAKDIGIRGNNIFTITYSLLAMFFSTVVTYFIIVVQQDNEIKMVTNSAVENSTIPCV